MMDFKEQARGKKREVQSYLLQNLQIAVSRKYIDYHTEKFGYKEPNTDFVQGYIEKLREAGLKESYYNIIM